MADTGYTPLAERDQRLYCGSPQQIAREVDVDTILEHFGEGSLEYLAYEHWVAEQIYNSRERQLAVPFPTPRERPQQYRIPGRTESPRVSKGMLEGWIREFAQKNEVTLPRGFSQRDFGQLLGMYRGMLETYGISEKDIVPERE